MLSQCLMLQAHRGFVAGLPLTARSVAWRWPRRSSSRRSSFGTWTCLVACQQW